MANGGWHSTSEEWDRLDKPLASIDLELQEFASQHGMHLSKNHKNWPERSLAWGDSIRCLIQLFAANEAVPTFNFWICASEDRGQERFWKREFLKENEPFAEIRVNLQVLLNSAKQKLDHWMQHPELLEFATKLSRLEPK